MRLTLQYPLDRAALARYLGYPSHQPPARDLPLLQQAEREILKTAAPRCVFARFALARTEEGLLLGLPPNRGLRDENGDLYDIVCGTFFLCGAPSDGESFTSLTPAQATQMERRFHTPEVFVGMGGRIVCLPME